MLRHESALLRFCLAYKFLFLLLGIRVFPYKAYLKFIRCLIIGLENLSFVVFFIICRQIVKIRKSFLSLSGVDLR